MGYIVAFSYSYFLCTLAKLYILLSVLIIGMTGYCIVEYLVHTSNKDATTTVPHQKKAENSEDNPMCSVTKSYDAIK